MSMSSRPRPTASTSTSTRPSTAGAPSAIRRVPSRINLTSRQPSTSTAQQQQRDRGAQPSPPLSPGSSARSKLSGSGSGGLKKDAEGNINVVVRCRGLSSRETNSTLVAEVEKTRGSTIILHDPDPTASSSTAKGSAAQPTPTTRTYEFGDRHVYGSDANQSMMYMDVAKPILEQVMQGYNCTIFAYGQTGTGKTYTMEGDLTSVGGTFTPDAGIIPRTLYGLFQKLAEDRVEFSVRCSFVELYNEELRDLNAMVYDDSPSAPMDPRTGKPKPGGGLKIFEDKAAGVVIQGLEETLILNAEEGLKVLKRGSERRQIAATKCNDRSSRSHSIFSLQIHTKEVKNGEDLLKVGKLNLVDLAGSENVQRSGAENDTAREAGIINASLLALGRVINKLVEKQTHIPYRDSKLTRLLQDSLGGRTKTTIIATISPVNFEETSSTLDYAARAKTIENRPQLNARMTKGLLMSQFAIEIERLKLDLLAVREKNGMYFSAESWAELSAEQDQRKAQLEEQRQRAEVFESNFQGASEQLAQNLMLLGATQQEMDTVRERNLRVKQEVKRLAEELLSTRGQLEGQTVLREAYEQSRAGWKSAAGVALSDVDGLFAKLERKTTVEDANKVTITNASSSFAAHTTDLLTGIDALRETQQHFATQLEDELATFAEREAEQLASHVKLVDERLASLELSSSTVQQTAGDIEAQGTAFAALVEATRRELLETIRKQAQEAKDEQEARGQELMQNVTEHSNAMHATIAQLAEPMRVLRAEAEKALEEQREVLTQVEAREKDELKAENARLRDVVAQLSASLEAERQANVDEDDELVKLLAEQLAQRSTRRAAALSASQSLAASQIESAVSARSESATARAAQLDSVSQSSAQLSSILAKRAAKVESVRREGEGRLAGAVQTLQDGMIDWAIAGEQAQTQHVEAVESAEARFEQGSASFRTDASSSRATFERALEGLVSDAVGTMSAGRAAVERVGEDIATTAELLSAQLASQAEKNERGLSSTGAQIERLAASIGPHLSSQLKQDIATGFTPIKRAPPQDTVQNANLDTPSKGTMLEQLLAAKREFLEDPFTPDTIESLSPLLAEGGDEDALPPVAVAQPVLGLNGAAGRKSSLMGGGKQPPVLSERDANRRRETGAGAGGGVVGRGSELLAKSARVQGARASKVVL